MSYSEAAPLDEVISRGFPVVLCDCTGNCGTEITRPELVLGCSLWDHGDFLVQSNHPISCPQRTTARKVVLQSCHDSKTPISIYYEVHAPLYYGVGIVIEQFTALSSSGNGSASLGNGY